MSCLYALIFSSFCRCTTSCLLCFLSSAYPAHATVFQFLISLDFMSHWMHMYRSVLHNTVPEAAASFCVCLSTLLAGEDSHKKVQSDVSFILHLYYHDPVCVILLTSSSFNSFLRQTTLFAFCAGNELFFIGLYLMKSYAGASPIGYPFLQLALLAPKSWAPLIASLTWPQLLAVTTAPICLGKNIINVVQLWKASKILVGIDLATRQAKKLRELMKENDKEE